MGAENVYIALIINKYNIINFSSYDDVIALINKNYPMNKLVIEKYLNDGSENETYIALNDFISKYPSGKRATITNTTSIVIACSNYFIENNLNILSISLVSSSTLLKNRQNIITYGYSNQYSIMSLMTIYIDYQITYMHVLYEPNTINDIFFRDYLNQIELQASLLNINLTVSILETGKYNYNIKQDTMVIILADNDSLQYKFITPKFIQNFPKKSFIMLSDYNKNITDIFETIPTIVQIVTNINYTPLSENVYNSVKNNSGGFDYTIYPLYDILFMLYQFTVNNLEINKENYILINPYGSSPPAWLLNTSISLITNGTLYGKYQYTFTKDVIIGNNKNLFLQYYDGGQQQLPDSYSIFKIAGITPNNASLIEYDEAIYYEIYDNNNKLVCVKFNSDITNFPIGKNLNVGKTVQTKFIYKYNDEGYFIKLERLYPYNGVIPQVNSTMSKVPVKLKYII